MDKIYRIGSFNLHNIGTSAFTNARDLEKIAEIIKKEHLDVVALQKVLTEGDVFTKNDLHSVTAKQKTMQDQLTTLKSKNKDSSDEAFTDRGYASNYDHLSTDEAKNSRNFGKKFMELVNASDVNRELQKAG